MTASPRRVSQLGPRSFPAPAWEASDPPRRSRLLAWAPVAAVVAVAIVTGWVIVTLRDGADQARRVQVEIVRLHASFELPAQLLKRSVALPARGPGGGVPAGARDPIKATVVELAALRGRVGSDAGLDLVIRQADDAAKELSNPDEDPATGKRIATKLEGAFVGLERAQARTVRARTRIGDIGTGTLIALAALGVGLLLRRFDRLRDRDGKLHADHLRAMALQDSLTGLANRRCLERDLEAGAAAAASGRPLALLLFDLNGFKGYNDAFGHHAGDLLLQRLARRLQAVVERSGDAYRLGGDEFCVLVRGEDQVDIEAACLLALSDRGDGFEITSSVGTARIPSEAADGEEALRLADDRMYTHKDGGRVSAALQTREVALRLLAAREPEREGPSHDIGWLAESVGRELGIDEGELRDIVLAAELRDLGKVALPFELLQKPGPLDEHEWELVRRHPAIGAHILRGAPSLERVAVIVAASHERFDGTGYPSGIAGQEIPIGSRVVFVCGAYGAMTTERPYRPALAPAEAVAELRRNAGTQFDADVVRAFETARADHATEASVRMLIARR
jgi:diguanylate cyclase (GGDEF)-like protein